jgi:hypothetical protein
MCRTRSIFASLFVATFFGVVTAGTALAHDVHTFGKMTVALGWLHEPAYVGFDNAVQVLVKDAKGNPITDISDADLTVDVSIGTATKSGIKLIPTADPDTGLGTPGEFEAHFIPTAVGKYTFHLKGTVTGQAIDETVTSGDKTFNEVTDAQVVEFPNVIPAAADLNAKLDQVTQRNQAAISNAQSSADWGRNLAIAAIVVAVILSVINMVAIMRRRER